MRKPDQEPVLGAHAINSSTGDTKASGSLEFKASLVYVIQANLAYVIRLCVKNKTKVQPVVCAVLGRLRQEVLEFKATWQDLLPQK